MIESQELNKRFGARILFKPETLQRTGSFKFRGAYSDKRSSLSEEERSRGVVAFSSGNHAQGVRGVGGDVRRQGGHRHAVRRAGDEDRQCRKMGAEVGAVRPFSRRPHEVVRPYIEKGLVLVPPFDDPHHRRPGHDRPTN
ncbi:pyridoxal-phosphate dependent enzyme [Mesorhizobium newzealandense]|uniref:Pyridoxal-phosphate dependent enzyme n=1 Tax=Mesorhizobium newzealandense TaxID=1300302 RepID=A0ABW4UPU5_9HYPH